MTDKIKKIIKEPMDKLSVFIKNIGSSFPYVFTPSNRTIDEAVCDDVPDTNKIETNSLSTTKSNKSVRVNLMGDSSDDKGNFPHIIGTQGTLKTGRIFGREQQIEIEEVQLHDSSIGTIQVSDKEFDQLLRDVQDIKEMSIDMADILGDQQTNIDKIEENIDNADTHLKQSNKELQQALKYKKDGIHNVLGVTAGAIAGSFLGPIGAAGGALVGLSSTALYNHIR